VEVLAGGFGYGPILWITVPRLPLPKVRKDWPADNLPLMQCQAASSLVSKSI
jgi:hypothetical protein